MEQLLTARYDFFLLALIFGLLGLRAWAQQRRLRVLPSGHSGHSGQPEHKELRGQAWAGLGCGSVLLLLGIVIDIGEAGPWWIPPADIFDWLWLSIPVVVVVGLVAGLWRDLIQLRRSATRKSPTTPTVD